MGSAVTLPHAIFSPVHYQNVSSALIVITDNQLKSIDWEQVDLKSNAWVVAHLENDDINLLVGNRTRLIF